MILEVTEEGIERFMELSMMLSYPASFRRLGQNPVGLPNTNLTPEEEDVFDVLYKVIWWKDSGGRSDRLFKLYRDMYARQGIKLDHHTDVESLPSTEPNWIKGFKSNPVDVNVLLNYFDTNTNIPRDRAKRAINGIWEAMYIKNVESEEYD